MIQGQMTREQQLGAGFAYFMDNYCYLGQHAMGEVTADRKKQSRFWAPSMPGAAFLLDRCGVARFKRV